MTTLEDDCNDENYQYDHRYHCEYDDHDCGQVSLTLFSWIFFIINIIITILIILIIIMDRWSPSQCLQRSS